MAPRHLVEINVAALLDRAVHVDAAVAAALPAGESAVADHQAAATVHDFSRGHAHFEQRQRVHRLDRGARRVQPLGDLVEQRQMVVSRQHLPFGAADAVGKTVGIVGRHRDECEDAAGLAVDDDDRARLVTHPPRRILLQRGIDGQLDGVAAAVGLGLELADQFTPCGELDPLPAGRSTKIAFKCLFKSFLADLEPRCNQKRVFLFLIILG